MVVLDGKGGGSTLTKRDVEAHDDDPLLVEVGVDDDDDGEVASERDDDDDGASLLVVLRNDPAAVRLCALCLLLSFVTGTAVGVVPAVMTERYARLDHGRVGPGSCAAAAAEDPACARGADDAQEAAAASAFALHGVRFLSSAVVGAATDARGRRGALAAGVALAASAPLALAWTIVHERTRPEWYYACDAASGVVYWFGVAASCAADVVPPEHRAASFGYLVVARYAAAAVVPFLAVIATPLTVSVLSAAVAVAATVFAYAVVPETSPAAKRRKRKHDDDDDDDDDRERRDAVRETLSLSVVSSALLRPFRELSVLNRNNYLRLLTVLSFASGLVLSGERTFFVYYLENHLRFTDRDIARFFLFNGVAALLVQGVLVGRAVEALGERRVVLVAFVFGVVHNLQFAVARSRTAVYLAVVGAKITGAAYPTVSAMKAGAVGEEERGRVQGAFFSLTALSEALGPAALQAVYRRTKNRTVDDEHYWRGSLVGPGSMFVAAAAFYAVGTIAACALPRRPDTEPRPRRRRPRYAKTTKI